MTLLVERSAQGHFTVITGIAKYCLLGSAIQLEKVVPRSQKSHSAISANRLLVMKSRIRWGGGE
jgi:hypothetical protein